MSMIDHTLDPLPKRITRTDEGEHGGRMWFSKETVFQASHYADVPWIRVLAPAVLSLSLVLAGLLTGPGSLSGLALLVGFIGCVLSLPATLLKMLAHPKAA
tara:strand:- start:652 stop:954 length:303 start_codon:yes stop_codon:yes gene_type:complete